MEVLLLTGHHRLQLRNVDRFDLVSFNCNLGLNNNDILKPPVARQGIILSKRHLIKSAAQNRQPSHLNHLAPHPSHYHTLLHHGQDLMVLLPRIIKGWPQFIDLIPTCFYGYVRNDPLRGMSERVATLDVVISNLLLIIIIIIV